MLLCWYVINSCVTESIVYEVHFFLHLAFLHVVVSLNGQLFWHAAHEPWLSLWPFPVEIPDFLLLGGPAPEGIIIVSSLPLLIWLIVLVPFILGSPLVAITAAVTVIMVLLVSALVWLPLVALLIWVASAFLVSVAVWVIVFPLFFWLSVISARWAIWQLVALSDIMLCCLKLVWPGLWLWYRFGHIFQWFGGGHFPHIRKLLLNGLVAD